MHICRLTSRIEMSIFVAMLLIFCKSIAENKCDIKAVSDLFLIKTTEENSVSTEGGFMYEGSAVEVICKSSKALSVTTCHGGKWQYQDHNCVPGRDIRRTHKRRKRFFGFIIRAIVCIFSRCSKPARRDSTKPEIRNCPSDISAEAIPYQFFAFVSWTEPTAWDSVDGNLGITRHGKRPGAPFFEGTTVIQYSAKDKSGNTQSCSFKIHITVVRCPTLLPRIKDGYRLCHLSFDMVKGTTCKYGCYQGHDLMGGPSIGECLPTGVWSIDEEPFCKKKTCQQILTSTGQWVNCSDQWNFRSICTYFCDDGYDIPGKYRRAKVCLASGSWNGDNPYCADIQPPEFVTCPTTLLFYPEDNEDTAAVYWDIPTVSDNHDPRIEAQHVSGPVFGSHQNVGTYTVTYTAVDLAGNSASCSFKVVVKQLRCSRLYPTPYLHINCTGTRRGSSCEFYCDENSTLNGTRQSYCLRVADQPYSKWTMGRQPFCQVTNTCPELTAPRHGALACDVWLGGRLCHPSCTEGFSVLISTPLPEFVICDDDGKWLYEDKVTDCIDKEKSNKRLAVLTSEFYFKGDCKDENVQNEIKSDFMTTIQGSLSWSSKCRSECHISNIKVICGETKRRKKSTTNLLLAMDLDFQSDSNDILTSDKYETEVQSLVEIVEQLKDGLSDSSVFPSFDSGDIEFLSITSSSLEIVCPENFVSDYGDTIGCVPCPPGKYFDPTSEKCEYCQRGSYQPSAAQNKCLSCPPYYSTAIIGATDSRECEEACWPGTFSTSGLPPCNDCDVGFYENNYGSTGCKQCPGNKITVAEKTTNESECQDFDIVFPAQANNSFTTFAEPVEPLYLPFTVSMHVQCDSQDGHIFSLTSSGLNLTLTYSNLTINRVYESLHERIIPTNKWLYIAVLVNQSKTTMFMDDQIISRLPIQLESPVREYQITLGGLGFAGTFSQFMITRENEYGEKSTSYRNCSSDGYPDGVFTWNDFAYSNMINSYIEIPSKCDDTDECISNPCMNGTCINQLHAYSCLCVHGFTGVECDINIDDCEVHACQNNATCIDGVGTFSCACDFGFTGQLCEVTMVDGNWADWDNWTDCSVSCGNGTKQRQRSCSNPLPDNGGQYCEGNDTETEECILDPCKVCSDIIATNHSTVSCVDVNDLIICNQTCDDGYWFDQDVKDDYRCGRETSYDWDFRTDDNPYARLPHCTKIIEPNEMTVSYTAFYDKVECDSAVQGLIEEVVSREITSITCRQNDECIKVSHEILHCDDTGRKRRDLTSENVGFKVVLSCDVAKEGTEVCYQTLGTAVEEIEASGNNSQLDFFRSAMTYRILSDTTSSDGVLQCPVGTTPYILYCVPCSIGHYYSKGECYNCPVGSYQDKTEQTYCHSCPDGTTTEGTASLSLDDCVVLIESESKNKPWYIIGIALGSLSVFIVIVVVTILYCRQTQKQFTSCFTKNVPLEGKMGSKTKRKSMPSAEVRRKPEILTLTDMT